MNGGSMAGQHLALYSEVQGAAAVDELLGGVADQVLMRNLALNYILPQPARLLWWYGQGATLDGARLNVASLRQVALPRLSPFMVGALPGNLPPIVTIGDMGVTLPANEEIQVDTSDTGAGVRNWVALGLQFHPLPVESGPIYTIRATSVGPAVAVTWTAIPLTYETNLPVGRYQIVGMRAWSATMTAARILFNAGGYRPGVIGSASEAQNPGDHFRRGRMGAFGYFDSVFPPALEVFCTAADAVFRCYFDIIKVR